MNCRFPEEPPPALSDEPELQPTNKANGRSMAGKRCQSFILYQLGRKEWWWRQSLMVGQHTKPARMLFTAVELRNSGSLWAGKSYHDADGSCRSKSPLRLFEIERLKLKSLTTGKLKPRKTVTIRQPSPQRLKPHVRCDAVTIRVRTSDSFEVHLIQIRTAATSSPSHFLQG